jgi:hypothetical protein
VGSSSRHNEFESRTGDLLYHKRYKPERIKAVIDRTIRKITKSEIMELCPDISQVTG